MSRVVIDPFSRVRYDAVDCENAITRNPKCTVKKVLYRITLNAFRLAILSCIIFFIVLPIIYKYSYNFQRATVFLNFINVPSNANYDQPESYGLNGVRNFYITTKEVKLGTWQILPASLENSTSTSDEFFDSVLNNGQNIVIYNHGNGGCRLSPHRIELYRVLRKYFHVIAFDYRSYGDSSKHPPTELDLVEDIVNVYRWVRNRTNSNIFIWGHSLGTSLSTHALIKLQSSDMLLPIGLVLESPFNNLREEISEFPLAQIFKFLPWFDATILNPMAKNFYFKTDEYICSVNVPIMILHAEDDKVVPFRLGRKLYQSARQCRNESQGNLSFHAFSGDRKFGHKYICRAEEFPSKISNFIQLALQTKDEKHLQY